LSIILGIDPGSYVTGFGVVRILPNHQVEHVSHGVIALSKNLKLPFRLAELSEGITEILEKYQPQHVVIEKIFLGRSADSAFVLGHARGVVMSQAALMKAHIYEYATRVVKKGVAGKGSADKLQVQQMTMHLLRLKKIDHLDASDALALALYHSQQISIARTWKQGMKEL
jgi:crossover junction endodeoxyribonuclease RuvC